VNESIFRDANEQIERARTELDVRGSIPYLCECPEPRCTELVLLTAEEYGRVRAGPSRFVVRPGHASGAARIVEEGAFVIVELEQGAGEADG
jgi:hypothetical protein